MENHDMEGFDASVVELTDEAKMTERYEELQTLVMKETDFEKRDALLSERFTLAKKLGLEQDLNIAA